MASSINPSLEPVAKASFIQTERDHIPAFTAPVPWIKHNKLGFVKKSLEM